MSVKSLVGAVIVAAVLCLGWGAEAKDTSITYWYPANDSSLAEMQKYAREFEQQNPGIKVNVVYYNTIPDTFLPAAAGGVMPDGAHVSYAWINSYAAKGFLVDLTPYMQQDRSYEELNKDFIPGSLAAVQLEKKTYALPFSLWLHVTFHNRAVLQKWGLTEPPVGLTWDDLLAYSRKLYRLGANGDVESYGVISYTQLSTAVPFVLQAGGRFFDDSFHKATVDSPEMLSAVRFMMDMRARGLLSKPLGVPGMQLFTQGKGGFYMDSDGRAKSLQSSMEQLAATPALKGSLGTPATALTYSGPAVVKTGDPEREAVAYKFVKFLASAETQARFGAFQYVIPSRFSAIRSSTYTQFLRDNEVLRQVAMNIAPFATGAGFIGLPNWQDWYSKALIPALKDILVDNPKPAQNVISTLQQQTQVMIDEYWK